jgi:hypothetical protein
MYYKFKLYEENLAAHVLFQAAIQYVKCLPSVTTTLQPATAILSDQAQRCTCFNVRSFVVDTGLWEAVGPISRDFFSTLLICPYTLSRTCTVRTYVEYTLYTAGTLELKALVSQCFRLQNFFNNCS